MRCPTLAELPAPPVGKTGWPWTEETEHLPEKMEDGTTWPRITIVTASYNRADFIEETIRSILLQGYPDFEYIIIDGASADGTVDVIKKYESWLTYWESEPDRGQSHALNKGLARATGDIITYFSSDDYYLPSTFADVGRHWPLLSQKGYGAVSGGFYRVDLESKQISQPIPSRIPPNGPHDLTTIPVASWRLHQEATFYAKHALDYVGREVLETLLLNADRELLIRISQNFIILLSGQTYSAFRWDEQSGTANHKYRFTATLEYAKLFRSYSHLRDGYGWQRWRVANHLMAKAYQTYAKYSDKKLKSIGALLLAFLYRPSFVTNRGYLMTWAIVLGLQARS